MGGPHLSPFEQTPLVSSCVIPSLGYVKTEPSLSRRGSKFSEPIGPLVNDTRIFYYSYRITDKHDFVHIQSQQEYEVHLGHL